MALTPGKTANLTAAETQASYTASVRAIKQGQDNVDENLSMMRFSLYQTAYIEKLEEASYEVTLYFRDAEVMGQTVYCESLGEACYMKEGAEGLVPAENDVYDPLTHTKAVTVWTSDLAKPIPVNVQMGTADMYLDLATMVEGVAPTFPQIKLAEGIFKGEIVGVVGGTGSDAAGECAVLSNGDIVLVGSTTSMNQDFSSHSNSKRAAFIAQTTSDGDLLEAQVFEGANMSSLSSVSVAEDDSFFVAGYYQNDAAPTGDFEGLAKTGIENPGRDAYIAKYDSQGKRIWARSISSSFTEQFETVIATDDGGCVASAEVMFTQGKEYDGNIDAAMPGMVNAVVTKYDKDGNKEWDVAVACNGITDPQGGLALKSDGSYLLMVERTASNGFFEGAPFYGEGLDGETRFVDFEIGAASISKTGEATLLGAYGGNLNDSMNSAIATSDGGFAFVGSTESTTQTFAGHTGAGEAGYLAKCAADGTIEWVSLLNASGDSWLSSVVETDEGYVAVGGAEANDCDFASLGKGGGDAVVATFDEHGQRTSLRTFGGTKDDDASQVVPYGDEQLVLVGSNSADIHLKGLNRGSYDAVMLKTSYADAQAELADRKSAATFMNDADALANIDPIRDAEKVKSVRAAYEALTEDERSFVAASTLNALAAAESAVADANLENATVTLGQSNFVYTGDACIPAVTVTSKGGATLVVDEDYSVAYANNENAGIATVTVTGKGSYTGTASAEFSIAKATLAIPQAKAGLVYTGKEQTGVDAGKGYISKGNAAVEAGEHSATLAADSNHVFAGGETTVQVKWSIARATVAVPKGEALVFSGRQQTGVASGSGYSLKGSSATVGGTYQATATLDPNYQWADGSTEPKVVAWTISPAKQKVKAKAKTVKVSAKKLKTKSQIVMAKAVKKGVRANTALTFSKVKVNKKSAAEYFKVAKNGKITVKKGLAKGTYKITLKAKAKATGNYKMATKRFTVTIKVK